MSSDEIRSDGALYLRAVEIGRMAISIQASKDIRTAALMSLQTETPASTI
jgi:hypothetical protein